MEKVIKDIKYNLCGTKQTAKPIKAKSLKIKKWLNDKDTKHKICWK